MKFSIFAFLIVSGLPGLADTYTGVVSQVKHLHDGGIAVDLDGNYPHEKMILYISAEDAAPVGAIPAMDTKVTASGAVVPYRGVPEIKIHSADQWSWQNPK